MAKKHQTKRPTNIGVIGLIRLQRATRKAKLVALGIDPAVAQRMAFDQGLSNFAARKEQEDG